MESSTTKGVRPVEEAVSSATTSPAAHVLFWITATCILWLDLWSKHAAFTRLEANEVRPVIPGWIEFRRSLNAGAVFGTFTGRTSLFIVASVFALLFVLYVFAHSRNRQRSLHFALGLILAGAIGNLYDRAFIRADVVQAPGRTVFIGRVISEPDETAVRVTDWPHGERVQTFAADEITVRRQGVVRDFIKFVPRFPPWVPKLGGEDVWPWVFNVADVALVCGVVILLFHTWGERKSPHKRPSPAGE